MKTPSPFVRTAGSRGPAVVCLHSNGSTSAQWRPLMEMLAPQYRVFAPDLYGAGQTPDWGSSRALTLADEVSLIEPLLRRIGEPVTLVGHSYGAAVALVTALRHPHRVRALAVYEPTLFGLIDQHGPRPNPADGIRAVCARGGEALDRGRPEEAARLFLDYWNGTGFWDALPPARQAMLAASVTRLRRWGRALFHEPATLEEFRALHKPVLYMTGRWTTPSARGVARLLVPALPDVREIEFDSLGHMGPVAHPERVNRAIAQFLGLRVEACEEAMAA